ncbi:hypothetical protein BsWGS_10013 [Bradybaena similaris]
MEVSGKVAFVTGAAKGFGRAFAEALLGKGAKVVLADINVAVGTATYEELQRRFGEENVKFKAVDVTDHKQFRDAFNSAVSEFGHVDVMVNNAGILDESKWERMIETNWTAVVFGTSLAVEHMRKDKCGGGGRIINISSVAGLGDYYFAPVYCGTKHAVRSYTSSLALLPNIKELGVELGILCPDGVATDLMTKLQNDMVYFLDDFKKRFNETKISVSTVVDGFMELLQLQKMNGSILELTKAKGKSYRRMENVAA